MGCPQTEYKQEGASSCLPVDSASRGNLCSSFGEHRYKEREAAGLVPVPRVPLLSHHCLAV